MKLTLSTLALIAFANVPAFAFTLNGCAMKQIDGSNAYTAVEPGCLTDGGKGERATEIVKGPKAEVPGDDTGGETETPTKS